MTHRETSLKAAFSSACIVLMTDMNATEFMQRNWRHHGLGMLQTELSHTLRIHVWHPALRTIPEGNFRAVHDHRFTLTSFIMLGELKDTPYDVHPMSPRSELLPREPPPHCFEIAHAKEQSSSRTLVSRLGPVHATSRVPSVYAAGDVYTVERGDFHTTAVDNFCITVVNRSSFGDRPARVLGPSVGEVGSGIVLESSETYAIREHVLKKACEWLFADPPLNRLPRSIRTRL